MSKLRARISSAPPLFCAEPLEKRRLLAAEMIVDLNVDTNSSSPNNLTLLKLNVAQRRDVLRRERWRHRIRIVAE
jgi:hypothetical protein